MRRTMRSASNFNKFHLTQMPFSPNFQDKTDENTEGCLNVKY